MRQRDDQAMRSQLLAELARLRKIGFLVVDEAFEVAQDLDLASCSGMPMTMMAIIASERGFAQFKLRLQLEAAHSDAPALTASAPLRGAHFERAA